MNSDQEEGGLLPMEKLLFLVFFCNSPSFGTFVSYLNARPFTIPWCAVDFNVLYSSFPLTIRPMQSCNIHISEGF